MTPERMLENKTCVGRANVMANVMANDARWCQWNTCTAKLEQKGIDLQKTGGGPSRGLKKRTPVSWANITMANDATVVPTKLHTSGQDVQQIHSRK